MKYIFYILQFIFCLLYATSLQAQNSATPQDSEQYVLTDQEIEQISEDISSYIGELNNLAGMISVVKKMSNIRGLESSLQSINVRWTTYYSLEQKDISLNGDLTQMLVEFQQLYKVVSDSIAKQKDIVGADDNFTAAEKFISNAEGRYSTFLADATKWSLTSKTSKQLDAVKAEEQLLFQQIDKQYQTAQAAAALDPKLSERMTALENVYVNIKGDSETVQAAAYMPFLLRIKDYILSLAGVAIIILFITMAQSKMSAIKAARKAAKEAKQRLMKANKEIPEI